MNHCTIAKQFDILLSPVPEENESEYFSLQNTGISNSNLKASDTTKLKDIGKLKHSLPMGNRSVYLCKYSGKRKPPVCVHSNSSVEAVLRERKVEIKDLESQVVFLKNQIKALKVDNKTLTDIQARQDKELRKCKGGVADIPALLRSHKDEIKASESTAASLRRELWDSQKDLKAKYDVILRKDQHLDKLNLIIKRIERRLQEMSHENKELKLEKKKLEEECKKLVGGNEELKSKSDRLQKKIQLMASEILNFEEKLGTAEQFKAQLEGDLNKLQKKYEESLESVIELKASLQTTTQTVGTQTYGKETVSTACMTTNVYFGYMKNEKNKSSIENLEEIAISNNMNMSNYTKNGHRISNEAFHSFNNGLSPNIESCDKNTCSVPFKPRSTSPKKLLKDHHSGDHENICFSKPIEFNNSLQSDESYPNTDVTDDFLDKIIMTSAVKEADLEANSSFDYDNFHPVSSENKKPKRLFSNFTMIEL